MPTFSSIEGSRVQILHRNEEHLWGQYSPLQLTVTTKNVNHPLGDTKLHSRFQLNMIIYIVLELFCLQVRLPMTAIAREIPLCISPRYTGDTKTKHFTFGKVIAVPCVVKKSKCHLHAECVTLNLEILWLSRVVKSNGPRIEPWGTPHGSGKASERSLSVSIFCFLETRYDSTQPSTTPFSPYQPFRQDKMILWSIVSTAVDRSRITNPTALGANYTSQSPFVSESVSASEYSAGGKVPHWFARQ